MQRFNGKQQTIRPTVVAFTASKAGLRTVAGWHTSGRRDDGRSHAPGLDSKSMSMCRLSNEPNPAMLLVMPEQVGSYPESLPVDMPVNGPAKAMPAPAANAISVAAGSAASVTASAAVVNVGSTPTAANVPQRAVVAAQMPAPAWAAMVIHRSLCG